MFHFMINFTGELFTATERVELFQVFLLTAAVLAIIVVWGPKTLTRRQESLAALQKAAIE